MTIRVLGPLAVDSATVPRGRRDRVVLESLVLRAGHSISRDQLIDAVWGDSPPESAHKILQGCIVRLRRLLGAEVIETHSHGYRLAVAFDQVDAQHFERLVLRAREVLDVNEPERAEYLATEALALWRGPAFDELEEWEPGRIEAGRLNELRLEAEELRVDAGLRVGRSREVLADAQTMVNEAPLRERRWALLALAQYQAGNQGEALRTIHHMRTMLVKTLGLDPSPELDALEQAILHQDPELAVAAAVDRSYPRCPYQGLRPYDVDDSETFFGRDAMVAACLAKVRSGETVALVGPSGSGKSSLVRAGVAAALRRERRAVVVVTPGRRPLEAFARLETGLRGVVLVIDQFEEIFSICDDQDQQDQFVEALVAHTERDPLVIALRADRLPDIATYPALTGLVERGLHLLTPLTADGLRDAIERPARLAGLRIEPGLTDLLVREVENEPGALPLLSHALQETWKRREGPVLTVDGYRATGGIKGAVARSAEEIYAHTAAEDRPLLRDLVLRLVAPGVEGEPVRSRMPRRLLISDPVQDELLNLLVAARLVTSDDGVVEIAHEALARAWPRLRAWLDDDIEGVRTLHHLTSAADAWERLGRPDSELYRGVRLAQAHEWQDRRRPALTMTEAAFLAASEDLAVATERSAAAQARRQARMIRRLRAALGVAAVFLTVALVAGVLAARETHASHTALDRARSAEATADAHRLGAQAVLAGDVSLAELLAQEGLRLSDDTVTRSNDLAVLARQANLIWTSAPLGGGVWGLSVSTDGGRIAAYDGTSTVSLLDTAGNLTSSDHIVGEAPATVKGPLEFSPTQPVLAVGAQGYSSKPLQLLDPRTLKPLARQPRFQPPGMSLVFDVAYSADGRHLAASFQPQDPKGEGGESIMVWDLARPMSRPHVIVGTSGQLALSAHGSRVYTSWPLTGYDVSTGQRIFTNPALYTFVPMDLGAGGHEIALGINNTSAPHAPPASDALLVSTRSGTVNTQLPLGPNTYVTAATVSHRGDLLAVGSGDGRVQVWDAETSIRVLDLPAGGADALAFAPDDSTLFTAGGDGVVRAWDLAGTRAVLSKLPVQPSDDIGGVATPSPDGATVAVDTWATRRDFIDLETGITHPAQADAAGWTLDNDEPVGAAWRPDSRVYAVGGSDPSSIGGAGGLVETYTATGRKLDSVPVPAGVTGLDYSDDGARLVVSEISGDIEVLDATTLEALGPPVHVPGRACCVAASADGTSSVVLAATGAHDPRLAPRWNRWYVIDLRQGVVTASGSFEGGPAHDVAYSPDARRIALGLSHGMMRLVDATSGETIGRSGGERGNSVVQLVFDPSGDRLATSSSDGTIAVWDGRTGEPAESLPLGLAGVPEFVGGSDKLLVATGDASSYVWNLGLDRLEQAGCPMAGRNLTSDEWLTYLPGRPYAKTCPQFE